MEQALAKQPDDVIPYKILPFVLAISLIDPAPSTVAKSTIRRGNRKMFVGPKAGAECS
jgi:hypothetical protein